MPVYGETICKMHDGFRKLSKVFGPYETLDAAAYLYLKVAGDHVIWDVDSFLPHRVECCFNQICLICLGKGENYLLYHGAFAYKIVIVP